MKNNELDILLHPLAARLTEEYLCADPAAFAASKPMAKLLAAEFGDASPAQSAIATQIKYLQRARTKLPHYYEARCIIPPRAFEQAGSAECAAHKHYSGEICIDLTCGLGVDSANFSKHFARVISVERDQVLADIARINFSRLGITNVEVVTGAAEEFLGRGGLKADLIYADPDRRDGADRRLVLLEDCAPDVVALHGRMHEIAKVVVVKCSPLFDPAEAFRIFGAHVRVEAVSLSGECKELLIETGEHIPYPMVKASVAGGGSADYAYGSGQEYAPRPFDPPYRYLIIPDVSLRKMRMARSYFLDTGAWIESNNSYAFCNALPEGYMYRGYPIAAILPYKPKTVKTWLNNKGIKRLQIMQQGFPLPNSAIARQLGVKEGGQAAAAFCTVEGRQVVVVLGNE